jgi:hypothetical protein
MIIRMHQLNVGVPRYIDLHPEPKRIILVETKAIRVSLMHKRKDAGRHALSKCSHRWVGRLPN